MSESFNEKIVILLLQCCWL